MIKDPWVERFSREALPLIISRFRPRKVLLFGSRARGGAREDADLDIIIVSDHFKGVKFVNRSTLLYKTIKFPKHVDYLCYPPDEFDRLRNTSSAVHEAVETSEDLLSR